MKLGGQWRVAAGMSAQVIGYDMNAAFALGDALGIDRMAIAVFLPDVETAAATKLNESIRESNEPS